MSEIDRFACAVLKHHYPHVPNLGDMTKIAHMIRDGYAPAPDVLCGGTPCQAFSVAGLRNSLDDARGNLTLTFCEIADEIDTQRAADGLLPCVILWENVPGVLNTKDNAFGCFLAGLAGEDDPLVAPGGKWPNAGVVFGPQRTVAWRVLDAQYFGVAQRRRRVFVVASAREWFDPAAVLFELDGVRRDTAPSRETGQETAGTLASRTDGGGFPGTDEACSGYVQAVDVRNGTINDVAHTLQAGDHAPDPGGTPHALVRSVALRGREGGATAEMGDDLSGTLRAGGGGGDKAHVLAPIAFDSRQECVSSTEVFGALGSSSPQAQAVSYAIQAGALRTNPNSGPDGVGVQADIAYTLEARAEVQAVALPFDTTQVTSAANRSNPQYGDPCHPLAAGAHAPAIAFAARDVAGCITSNYGKQLDNSDTALGPNVAIHGMAVRRLTPRECERLQSFPDDYTLIPYGRVIKLEKLEADWIKYLLRGGVMTFDQVCQAAADGPRYKALGNSWCVHNVAWIGRRITAEMARGAA